MVWIVLVYGVQNRQICDWNLWRHDIAPSMGSYHGRTTSERDYVSKWPLCDVAWPLYICTIMYLVSFPNSGIRAYCIHQLVNFIWIRCWIGVRAYNILALVGVYSSRRLLYLLTCLPQDPYRQNLHVRTHCTQTKRQTHNVTISQFISMQAKCSVLKMKPFLS